MFIVTLISQIFTKTKILPLSKMDRCIGFSQVKNKKMIFDIEEE
jgi:hypothetical protein